MTSYQVRLTPGYLARHAPGSSAQGRSAAFIDVAQDLLLRELHDLDLLPLLAFKGGTAIRKVYAGASGRFSTDLDFAVRELSDDPSDLQDLLKATCSDVEVGGIRFGVQEQRGRLHITYDGDLAVGMGSLSSKLDIGPPPWLEPELREWQPLPIHDRYGGPLPHLPVVRLEENMAEKMARLNRRTYARDMYDLVWIARQPGVQIDRQLVRRLFVLKCWVDLYGLDSAHHRWSPVQGPQKLEIQHWLRQRSAREFDDEHIGLLTAPTPDLDDLGTALPLYYGWLADLDADEHVVVRGGAGDRTLVLALLADLPGNRLKDHVW